MKKILSVLLILSVVIIYNENVSSYPKFAALTGEKCMSCHVNPTGGGIRSRYGLHYARTNLYLKPFEKANKDTLIDPNINKTLQIGSDFRLIAIDNQREGTNNMSTFFQMQGDVYVNAKLNKYMNLVAGIGMDYPNTFERNHLQVKSELYGLIHNLPLNIHFKVGRFIQNFGLKIPEHRSYNRMFNDFYTPYAADAGIEFGFSPSFINLTLGLSNGNSPNVMGIRNNSYDFDNQKQFTSSLDFRWAAPSEKFAVGIGGSFLNNPYVYDPLNNINAVRQIGAGFISIGLSNIFSDKVLTGISILGEYDYNRLDISDSTNTRNEFNTIFGELNITIIKGLELKTQFESFDIIGDEDNPRESKRYSFGLVIYPLTGLELESIYRIVKEPEPLDIRNNEFQQTFKFYF